MVGPMRTFFVTRHTGAREWARRLGLDAQVITHFDFQVVEPGDVVMGTLPVHLAAEVCRRGGRYLHLSLDLPAELRGADLSADDMLRCGARLEEFRVERIGGIAATDARPADGGDEKNG